MEKYAIKDIQELIQMAQTTKNIFATLKADFKLTYEELYILNYIHASNSGSFNVREIVKTSQLKPYYVTKAVQKLKELGYLSKKRNEMDERTVIIEVSKAQRRKIDTLFEKLRVIL